MKRKFSPATLVSLREMPSEDALALLAIYLKADPTYLPVKDPQSLRWHALTPVGEFELLITGQKWWDTRAAKGGGGAIDLTMHLLHLSFVDAVRLLIERGHPDG